MDNHILAYYQQIQDGTVKVSKWVRLVYEYIVKGLENKSFFYNHKKAQASVMFVEQFCHHHEGELAPQRIKLELWQKALLSVIFGIVDEEGNRQFREVFIVMGRKNGKAVSLDTEVATPDGWVQMKDIHVGDYVFGQDGKPSKVLCESPIFNKPMYKVEFEDGSIVKASADHIWTVQTKKSREALRRKLSGKCLWMVKDEYRKNNGWFDTTTDEIAKDYKRIRRDGKGTEYKYRVPMPKPVEYQEKDLPIDPYTLGVWLGDGSKGSTEITTSADDLAEMRTNLEQEGHSVSVKKKRGNTFSLALDITERGKENKLRTALKTLGVFGNKHIPSVYLYSSVEQRMALLQGLMDTDGFCEKRGQCEFCQKDERITDQVRELLASLGIKSSKRRKLIICNGKECHAFSVLFYTDAKRPCFRLERKRARLKDALSERMNAKSIVSVERIENEPSKCIAIDNESHLYLVGRQYTATHNTLLASCIAEYCTFLDGEYGGRIYFVAPKLDQARLCFDAYYQMILQEPELSKMATKRRSDIYIESTNTSAKPLSFNYQKSDGLNISCCIADEISSWRGDAGLKQYEVLRSSFGSRKQGLLTAITTSGFFNDGIYDELIKRSTRFLMGESKEKRLLPFLYMIDDPDKWDDINELRKSNPNMGVSISADYLLDEIEIARVSLSKASEVKTKYACLKTNSSMAFLDSQVVLDACKPFDIKDVENTYAVAGVDLSHTTDLSCAVILVEKNNKIYCLSQFFLPRGRIEELQSRDGIPYEHFVTRGLLTLSGDRYIDYNDVYNWVTNMMTEHKLYILQLGYDRYSAYPLIDQFRSFGLKCDDVFQGDNLWGQMQMCSSLLEERRLIIGDNDLMKSHLLDSAVKMSHERGRGRLVKIHQTAHIDGFASILDGLAVRDKWWSEIGERLKNED